MLSILTLLLSFFVLLRSACSASPSNMSRPTFIFVPGAWHSPDAFQKVITFLNTKGYRSRKVNLPSVGRSPPVSSIAPDVEDIRNMTLSEMKKGHDIIVVCHSYGGLPTSQALKGLDRPQNAGGGQVLAIVYIAAFLLPEGVTVNAALEAYGVRRNAADLEFLEDGNVFFSNSTNPADFFYNDLSAEEGKYWVSKLKTQASATFVSPANYAAWKDIPSWYLIPQQDKTVPPDTQRAIVKEAREYHVSVGGPGRGDRMLTIEEIDAGHSPFLSRPEETADFIERAFIAGKDRARLGSEKGKEA